MTSYPRVLTRIIGLSASVLLLSSCSFIHPSSDLKITETEPTVKFRQPAVALIDEDLAPDVNASIVNNYKCELNDSLILYTNQHDDKRAALRWKNKLYGLMRVATTTGANRFENKKAGLVWIDIPSKGMLFDSKRGVQLANECKTARK
jgi:hypothetical protein